MHNGVCTAYISCAHQRGQWIPWNWRYKQMWVAMWLLETELKSSGRAVSAHNCQAISSVMSSLLIKSPTRFLCEIKNILVYIYVYTHTYIYYIYIIKSNLAGVSKHVWPIEIRKKKLFKVINSYHFYFKIYGKYRTVKNRSCVLIFLESDAHRN